MKKTTTNALFKHWGSKLVDGYKLPNDRALDLLLIDEPMVIIFSFQRLRVNSKQKKIKEYISWLRSSTRLFKETAELNPTNHGTAPLIFPVLVVPDKSEERVMEINRNYKTDKFKEIPVNICSLGKIKLYVESFYITASKFGNPDI